MVSKEHCFSNVCYILPLFKHWIAFCLFSRAIWIASEWRVKWISTVIALHEWFALLSDVVHHGLWTQTKSDSMTYIYILLTTKFAAVLFTLTQKCHISQISNEQKVRHLEQPSWRKMNWRSPPCDPVQIIRTKDRLLKFDYRKYSNFLLLYKSTCHLRLKWTQGKTF